MTALTDQITRAIHACAPHADAAAWASVLTAPMQSSGITTTRRIAMFVGQCAVESAGFDRLTEDLWYLSAEHIHETWPIRFPTVQDAVPFVGQPAALANHVYAARLGNGDAVSGDGWRFRGRGLIQITGRANYTALAAWRHADLDETVDWCASLEGAAVSACWFWHTRAARDTLNTLADAWNIPAATVLLNGGDVGHAARAAACNAALAAIEAEQPATPDTDTEEA